MGQISNIQKISKFLKITIYIEAQQVVAIGLNELFIAQAIDSLLQIQGVVIVYQYEKACECRDPNAYIVYPANDNFEQYGYPMFKLKEESNFWASICCPRKLRPFQVNGTNFNQIINQQNQSMKLNQNNYQSVKNLFHFDRPCSCPCSLPYMNLYHTENGSPVLIGKILQPKVHPYNCELQIRVFDHHEFLKYIIKGSRFQCIFWCPFLCDQKAMFTVFDVGGNPLVDIQKHQQGLCGKIGNIMKVRFPSESNKQDRALLMAAAIFMDHMYFQEQQERNI